MKPDGGDRIDYSSTYVGGSGQQVGWPMMADVATILLDMKDRGSDVAWGKKTTWSLGGCTCEWSQRTGWVIYRGQSTLSEIEHER